MFVEEDRLPFAGARYGGWDISNRDHTGWRGSLENPSSTYAIESFQGLGSASGVSRVRVWGCVERVKSTRREFHSAVRLAPSFAEAEVKCGQRLGESDAGIRELGSRVSAAFQETDVFRSLGSAISALWDQQVTAVLAKRFFERRGTEPFHRCIRGMEENESL